MHNYFIYFLFAAALFAAELIYFKLAKKYSIIDHPNERSSHKNVTIRGGGIIFPLAIIGASLIFKDASFFLIAAIFLAAVISFLDDVRTVPNYFRLFIHLIAAAIILYAFDAFNTWQVWIIIPAFVLIMAVINAFNFMDGINGITGIYSLVLLSFFFYINQESAFINEAFIIIPIIACIIFLFFNFRKKAKCFAGDVGSVCMGLWIVILLLMIIIKTGELKYLLFLSLYGVDTGLTILHRLVLKQNIFKPHRMHFFQYLVNERKFPHLTVAIFYGILQAITNAFILLTNYSLAVTFLIVVIPPVLVYFYCKFLYRSSIIELKKTV